LLILYKGCGGGLAIPLTESGYDPVVKRNERNSVPQVRPLPATTKEVM